MRSTYFVCNSHIQPNVCSTASLFYHAFVSLAYFSPLFGSIAADNYVGRFRVILWVSLIYVGGHVMLSLGAVPHFLPPVSGGGGGGQRDACGARANLNVRS